MEAAREYQVTDEDLAQVEAMGGKKTEIIYASTQERDRSVRILAAGHFHRFAYYLLPAGAAAVIYFSR